MYNAVGLSSLLASVLCGGLAGAPSASAFGPGPRGGAGRFGCKGLGALGFRGFRGLGFRVLGFRVWMASVEKK